jgi:hypothetical protein
VEFTWDVFVPGEDLPHRLTTDYLLSAGEEITVDGRAWLVEGVELIEAAGDVEEQVDVATGTVTVLASSDPGPP